MADYDKCLVKEERELFLKKEDFFTSQEKEDWYYCHPTSCEPDFVTPNKRLRHQIHGIQNVYMGKISDWKLEGWEDRGF